MPNNSKKEPVPIKDIDVSGYLDRHIDAVRPAIKELDSKQAESIARAPFVVVTNSTK